MDQADLEVFKLQLKTHSHEDLLTTEEKLQTEIDHATRYAFICKRQLTAIEEEIKERETLKNE